MYDSRVADAMEQRTSNSLLAFYTTMSQRGFDEAPLMYANEETEKDRTYILEITSPYIFKRANSL